MPEPKFSLRTEPAEQPDPTRPNLTQPGRTRPKLTHARVERDAVGRTSDDLTHATTRAHRFGARDQINRVHLMACLRALHQTGYPRLLHPDHVPGVAGDRGVGQRGGWGYAVGQIKAMLRQL